MQGLVVIVYPLLLMGFAILMNRVQVRLDYGAVGGKQVDEFLESADATDVDNLAKSGLPAALDELRHRHGHDDEATGPAS
ncbi:MAG: hypothetical protein QM809_02860 [Gordonia sp. (in: high G+C Gram-positive bacteria)]|uniref:hypothetical protein n=1 Tax=Gordonia sp. (in: high G+C Gram-positive bacteria) TaxID=84139 RepID=UPI0039E3D80E